MPTFWVCLFIFTSFRGAVTVYARLNQPSCHSHLSAPLRSDGESAGTPSLFPHSFQTSLETTPSFLIPIHPKSSQA